MGCEYCNTAPDACTLLRGNLKPPVCNKWLLLHVCRTQLATTRASGSWTLWN